MTASRVLCATDFSPCSRTATRLATAMARRSGDELLLLHVFEPPPLDTPGGAPLGSGWEQEMIATAEAALGRAAAAIKERGIGVQTRVLVGHPATRVLEAAGAPDVSLVVVGTHGRRGPVRLFLGSCAEQVVRSSPRPVLVAREQADVDVARWDGTGPLRLAAVATGSGADEAAFHWLRTSAPAIGNDVALVRVYWPPEEAARYGIDEAWLGSEGHPDLVRLVERDLRREAEALSGAVSPPVRLRAAGRDAAEVLAHEAAALSADALVMGVGKHGRGRWKTLSPGAVLRSANVPVFCVPEAIARTDSRRLPRIRSLLVASDLSDASRVALLPAYALLAGGGRIELCTVHERGAGDGLADLPARRALSEDERAAIEARLRAQIPGDAAEHGIATHISVLEGRFAAEAILQAAERLDVDAVALGSHGRSGIGRALFGSVAEEVARKSNRPVLIVHAGGAS